VNTYYLDCELFYVERGFRYIEGDSVTREHEVERKQNPLLIDNSLGLNDIIKRRDRHDIIVDILKTARDGKKKTQIMYKAKLSHAQLKLYLDVLRKSGLLENNDGVFKTTRKGLQLIKDFESINFSLCTATS